MPRASKKSQRKTMVKTYNLRSRAKKLREEVLTAKKRDLVTEPEELNEIALDQFVTQPLQIHEVIMLIQNGISDMNVVDTETSINYRETAGSPVKDIEENIYNNAINLHFKEKNISASLPDEEELPTAWEDITNLKISIIFEYSTEVLDDLLDEEEAKNAASSKFFKARYMTPRVTKKRTKN